MNYLDSIIKGTQAHNRNVKAARSNASMLLDMVNQNAQRATESANQATAFRQQTQQTAIQRAAQARMSGGLPAPQAGGGGGGGPHSAGDGHNHGSGGQSVGEANELWSRLQRMIKDSPHKITPGARSRDYATQVRLWNNYKAGRGPRAARPGTSKHGNGRANDLQYSNDAARAWALQNAGRYGLAFPIYNPNLSRSMDESWHVELARPPKKKK